jgi:hypothetical protein
MCCGEHPYHIADLFQEAVHALRRAYLPYRGPFSGGRPCAAARKCGMRQGRDGRRLRGAWMLLVITIAWPMSHHHRVITNGLMDAVSHHYCLADESSLSHH